VAKEHWLQTACNKVERGSSFNSWAAVRDIRGGLAGYYAALRQSKLLKEDGMLSKSDAETGEMFCKHFEKVFNNVRPIDESALEDVTQRETMEEHGVTPHPMEVKNAMKQLPIGKQQVNIRSPWRHISIFPIVILIIFMILLLNSGIFLTTLKNSTRQNYVSFQKAGP